MLAFYSLNSSVCSHLPAFILNSSQPPLPDVTRNRSMTMHLTARHLGSSLHPEVEAALELGGSSRQPPRSAAAPALPFWHPQTPLGCPVARAPSPRGLLTDNEPTAAPKWRRRVPCRAAPPGARPTPAFSPALSPPAGPAWSRETAASRPFGFILKMEAAKSPPVLEQIGVPSRRCSQSPRPGTFSQQRWVAVGEWTWQAGADCAGV